MEEVHWIKDAAWADLCFGQAWDWAREPASGGALWGQPLPWCQRTRRKVQGAPGGWGKRDDDPCYEAPTARCSWGLTSHSARTWPGRHLAASLEERETYAALDLGLQSIWRCTHSWVILCLETMKLTEHSYLRKNSSRLYIPKPGILLPWI